MVLALRDKKGKVAVFGSAGYVAARSLHQNI
jgi:hypothetical protein